MSLCAPTQTSPGRGPSAVGLGGWQSPVGASLTWTEVFGAVGYVVDRGTTASGAQTPIASTCANPGFFQSSPNSTTGLKDFVFRDQSGGIAQRTTYTYVVHAYFSGGGTGWNSVQWTSPTVPSLRIYAATVTGSTVKLKWDMPSVDPNTNKYVASPTDFLITSDYGFSLVKSRGSFTGCGCYVDVLGVPIGNHTFTITARWPPDVTSARTTGATVTP
jgi:hypothetical protein